MIRIINYNADGDIVDDISALIVRRSEHPEIYNTINAMMKGGNNERYNERLRKSV